MINFILNYFFKYILFLFIKTIVLLAYSNRFSYIYETDKHGNKISLKKSVSLRNNYELFSLFKI
jgi:hypothetical protein